jgi:steroid 5-alpha reductase family enzyme
MLTYATLLSEVTTVLHTLHGILPLITTDALTLSSTFLFLFMASSYVLGFITSWWSIVDRIWSVSPALYVVVFYAFHPENTTLAAMATLAVLWSVRLTLNFARKGGFGEISPATEDYRWSIVRGWMAANLPPHPIGTVLREAFHLFFVAVYQNILLFLQVVPACMLVAKAPPSGPPTPAVAALVLAFLSLLYLEHTTDEQQWAFQSVKHSLTPAQRAAAGGDFARGFCTTGIFKYSRHANFFAEQSLWWVFWGFGVAARSGSGSGGAPITSLAALLADPSILGPLLLTLLFQGSTTLTESITLGKYPEYKQYQATTSRLIPWFPAATEAEDLPSAAAAKNTPAKKQGGGGKRASSKARK